MVVIRHLINFTYFILFGTGFYVLDLSKDSDRRCLELLIKYDELCREIIMQKKSSPLGPGFAGDCSQLGNWLCY